MGASASIKIVYQSYAVRLFYFLRFFYNGVANDMGASASIKVVYQSYAVLLKITNQANLHPSWGYETPSLLSKGIWHLSSRKANVIGLIKLNALLLRLHIDESQNTFKNQNHNFGKYLWNKGCWIVFKLVSLQLLPSHMTNLIISIIVLLRHTLSISTVPTFFGTGIR